MNNFSKWLFGFMVPNLCMGTIKSACTMQAPIRILPNEMLSHGFAMRLQIAAHQFKDQLVHIGEPALLYQMLRWLQELARDLGL
jgi:hypothetical protein